MIESDSNIILIILLIARSLDTISRIIKSNVEYLFYYNSILPRVLHKVAKAEISNEAKGSENRGEHPIRQISPVLLSRGETEVHQRTIDANLRVPCTAEERMHVAEVSFFSFSPPLSLLAQSLQTGNRIVYEEDTRCWPSFCKCARSR